MSSTHTGRLTVSVPAARAAGIHSLAKGLLRLARWWFRGWTAYAAKLGAARLNGR